MDLVYPPGTPDWLRDPTHPALNFARFSFDRPEGLIGLPPNGPNLALRRSALAGLRFREDIGPDGTRDYAIGSETELLDRLRARGAATIYVPGAVVHHVVQPRQLATCGLRWALNAPLGQRRQLGAAPGLWSTPGQIAEHRSAARAATAGAGETDSRRTDGEARA